MPEPAPYLIRGALEADHVAHGVAGAVGHLLYQTDRTGSPQTPVRVLDKAKPRELAPRACRVVPLGSLEFDTRSVDPVGSLTIALIRDAPPWWESLARWDPSGLAQQRFRSWSADVGLEPGSTPPTTLKTMQRLNRLDVRLGR